MLARAAAALPRSTCTAGRRWLCASAPDDAAAPQTFIEKAKVYGVNSLLGLFTSSGDRFDRVLADMEVTDVGDGYCRLELPVTKSVSNTYKTLHGGAIATVVDVAGTLAIMSKAPTKPGVSLELNTSYVSAAKVGDSVLVEGRAVRVGKRVGFSTVELRRKSDGAVVATGRHTKAL